MRLTITVLLAIAPACDDGGGGSGDGTGPVDDGNTGDGDATDDGSGATGDGVDEDSVLEEAAGFRDAYVQINAEARFAQHAQAATANMWVQPAIADLYRTLDPMDDMATAEFPAGSVIVKEHLDDTGAFAGYAVMFKAEPGFNPDAGDWWWADVAADGAPIDTGALVTCITCHTPRAGADYVWGVPPDNRR